MAKKIFDLGSNNTFTFFEFWPWNISDLRKPDCRTNFLNCVRNHKPEECDHKRMLEEHMWTRYR